jgi:5-oxoprolinase (ATP-hydrolysing)
VTDANVMVGKIQPRYSPKVFGPNADEPLSYEAVEVQFNAIGRSATGRSAEVVAEGFINIAVQQMANAIKKISVARGYDVTRYTLQCFGGAGGQHACLVADALGMTARVRAPAGGRAVRLRHGPGRPERDPRAGGGTEAFARAARDCRQARRTGCAMRRPSCSASRSAGKHATHRRVHVRYQGSDSALVVPFGTLDRSRPASRPPTASASPS